jgi:photosystem II stability/assembly factor-like uncharacterized protein
LNSKLVSPGKGWATWGEHLFWTENNGRAWKEITPSKATSDHFGPIFFLDRSHGWVTTWEDTEDSKLPAIRLFSTRDGGKTWRNMVLRTSAFQLESEYFPRAVFFSDPRHGWMIWHWAVMHSYADTLLATADGGRTWKKLPDLPGGGPMDFISALDGWMIGDPEVREPGIGGPYDDTLWVTHNGGVHWEEVPVTAPTDSSHNVSRFLNVKFTNQRDGMLAAEEFVSSDDTLPRFVSLLTHDGGDTWQSSQFDALSASPSFGDTHIRWSVYGHNTDKTSLREDDMVISYILPTGVALDGDLGGPEFIDDSNGWAIYNNKNVPLFSSPGRGFAPQELLTTSDGGKTFQIITPPAAARYPFPQPELRVVHDRIVWLPPSAYRGKPWLSRLKNSSYPPPWAPAGGPIQLGGRGFLPENTVWFDSREVQVASKDGETLLFLIPADLRPGIYSVYIENEHGKTEPAKVQIYPQQVLHLTSVLSGNPPYPPAKNIHPGDLIWLTGSGFLVENTVWFGDQAVAAQSKDGTRIIINVPSSVAPGSCEIHVSNASGQSAIVPAVVE